MSQIEKIRQCADSGDADAQYELGKMYMDGDGVPRDYDEAVRWFRRAADQGHAGGQNGLGWAHSYGKGVSQDYKKAAKLYRLAADQGFAKAQHNVGVTYRNGEGVTQDFTEAVRWFRLAADQGYADAQAMLGSVCMRKGILANNEEARKWYQLAADQGHKGAAKAIENIDGMKNPDVLFDEFTIEECMECGRVAKVLRSRRPTTFGNEDVSFTGDFGDGVPRGGSINVVRTIRSSYCGHCHPEEKKVAVERKRSLDEWAGKIVMVKDSGGTSAHVVRVGQSLGLLRTMSTRINAKEVGISCSSGIDDEILKKGAGLSETELLDHIGNVRKEYEHAIDELRRSAGRFDWKEIVRKGAGAERAPENKNSIMREDVGTDPVPLYECAHCRSFYTTEENARNCAASCREKKGTGTQREGGQTDDVPQDVTVRKPYWCGCCRRKYDTEDEARKCSAECKEEPAKDWAGKIVMREWSSFTDIWVVRSHASSGGKGSAIWIRVHPEIFFVQSDGWFNPVTRRRYKELTEEEFEEQIERLSTVCGAMLDDLAASRGNFDWRSVIAKGT